MYKLRVKEILKAQGRTGRDLATELGMTEVGLYKAIGESGNPSLKRLQDIADALKVDVWELFASPNELHQQDSQTKIIVCPHCQNSIPVEMDINIKVE